MPENGSGLQSLERLQRKNPSVTITPARPPDATSSSGPPPVSGPWLKPMDPDTYKGLIDLAQEWMTAKKLSPLNLQGAGTDYIAGKSPKLPYDPENNPHIQAAYLQSIYNGPTPTATPTFSPDAPPDILEKYKTRFPEFFNPADAPPSKALSEAISGGKPVEAGAGRPKPLSQLLESIQGNGNRK